MNNSLMTLSNADTAKLLPSSVSEDPDVKALLQALDELWRNIAQVIPRLGVMATIDEQPDDVVTKLAHQLHVDYWQEDWPIETKRHVVKDAIRLHRIAGTRGAVEDVIKAIWGDGAAISEWWEHGGEPGTFVVTLTESQTQTAVQQFVESIRSVKRATDHLTVSIVNNVDPSSLHIGIVTHQFTSYRI